MSIWINLKESWQQLANMFKSWHIWNNLDEYEGRYVSIVIYLPSLKVDKLLGEADQHAGGCKEMQKRFQPMLGK